MDLLSYMINRDVMNYKEVKITHHQVHNPTRIKVAIDEIIYINNIKIEAYKQFNLGFYSAIESRKVTGYGFTDHTNISRHIGSINFVNGINGRFLVSYAKLKIIK